jgi:competence protein ComEA
MDPTPSRREPHWLLRRADQAVVALLVLVGLGTTIGWWFSQGGWGGRLVEVEHARPQVVRFQVDINSAAWPELAELPGVGRTLAQRIVQSRHAEGPFVDHEDLRRVRGIGPKTLESLRPYLCPIAGNRNVAAK